MKRTIPMLITSVGGIIMIVSFFIPIMQDWSNEVSVWFNLLAAVAFVLGGGNLIKLNLQRISERKAGWGYGAVTLIAFAVTLGFGLLKSHVPPAAGHIDVAWSGAYDAEGGWFWWVFVYIISPLLGTMFALLAFFVASAAYRAFRAKNLEATLLLVTAVIVLLGQVYLGYLMTKWVPQQLVVLTFPGLKEFIVNVFNTAGQRAIMIGMALGIVAVSLKIILGIDRSYLGADTK